MVNAARWTLCILLLAAVCDGAAVVSLKSRNGYVGSAGQRFRFAAHIERNEKNRLLCFEWASAAFSGSSCDKLDGDKTPQTVWRDITFRLGGEYNVIAWVLQNDDSIHKSNIETIMITDRLGQ